MYRKLVKSPRISGANVPRSPLSGTSTPDPDTKSLTPQSESLISKPYPPLGPINPQPPDPKDRAQNLFSESALLGVESGLDDEVVHSENHLQYVFRGWGFGVGLEVLGFEV